jgi:hypothetical protein
MLIKCGVFPKACGLETYLTFPAYCEGRPYVSYADVWARFWLECWDMMILEIWGLFRG